MRCFLRKSIFYSPKTYLFHRHMRTSCTSIAFDVGRLLYVCKEYQIHSLHFHWKNIPIGLAYFKFQSFELSGHSLTKSTHHEKSSKYFDQYEGGRDQFRRIPRIQRLRKRRINSKNRELVSEFPHLQQVLPGMSKAPRKCSIKSIRKTQKGCTH